MCICMTESTCVVLHMCVRVCVCVCVCTRMHVLLCSMSAIQVIHSGSEAKDSNKTEIISFISVVMHHNLLQQYAIDYLTRRNVLYLCNCRMHLI